MKPASERAEEFRREWETLPDEEKKAALYGTKCQLNHILTLIQGENERSDHTAALNGCEKEICPRKFHWTCLEQTLQTAILALEDHPDAGVL